MRQRTSKGANKTFCENSCLLRLLVTPQPRQNEVGKA